MSTVMLPEIKGRSVLSSIDKIRDKRVMDIVAKDGRCTLRITHYRHDEDEHFSKEALVLYISELDELCRWWSEVKRATK